MAGSPFTWFACVVMSAEADGRVLLGRHDGGLAQADLPFAIRQDPQVSEATAHNLAGEGMARWRLVDLLSHQQDFMVAAWRCILDGAAE